MVQQTVQKAIENFEQSSTGDTIKTALVDLIETLNSVGGNTLLLGGHQQNYYVLENEVADIENTIYLQFLQYDTEPNEGSVNLLKNKDFYKYFVTGILKKLQSINGDYGGKVRKVPLESGDIGYNIKDTLNVLDNTVGWNGGSYTLKEAINAHLSDDNDKIKDTDSFMDFSKALNKVKYGRIMVTPLNADTNKTYEAEENCAWNPVVVKLKLKGYPAVVNQNGNVELPQGYDGFSSVDVKVPGGGGGSGSGSSTGGRVGELGNGGEANVGPTSITENGEYNARNYQLDGFSQVHVNVRKFEMPEGKTFNVKFVNHDGSLLWERKEVSPGSNVFYGGSPNPPVYKSDSLGNEICDEFWTFSGWDPMPLNVLCDMTCVAQYSNWNPNNGNPAKQPFRYTTESWENIIKNGGDNVEIGDIKILKIGGNKPIRMRKVSNSTTGANSIWISMDSIQVPSADNNDWENCNVRTYLNGTFYDSLPEFIKSAITPMSKIQLKRCSYAASLYPNGPSPGQWGTGNLPPIEPPSLAGLEFSAVSGDKIWLPSLHELNLLNEKDNGEFALNMNSNGAPYTLGNGNWNIANKDSKMWKEYHYPKRSYLGLIYTGASANYGGDIYSSVYKYFKYAQGYRSFITNLAKGSEYRDCELNSAIRKQLPHIKRTVTGGDDSKSLNWDSLSYATQMANQASEPPLDIYKILQEWDNYIPNISFDGWEVDGYNTWGYPAMYFKSTALRDVYLYRADYKYTASDGWTFSRPDSPPVYRRAMTNGFGFPNFSGNGIDEALFGFGLG